MDDPDIPGTAGFYLTALDIADKHAIDDDPGDAMTDDALAAICHAVDGIANEADHRALLAWGTKLRLQGEDEAHVRSLLAVADDILAKL